MEDRAERRLSLPRERRWRGLRGARRRADAAGDDRVDAGDREVVAMRFAATIVVALAFGSIAIAQKPHEPHAPLPSVDAVNVLPKNFTREFENEWVDVTRTHYDANSKLPAHEHKPGITVYLYLNASDGVLHSHIDGDASVPRRPVVAGGIRV